MSDPKFVRLADRLAIGGTCADVNSGWSICGFDVKQFPDEDFYPGASKFVRKQIRLGNLEEAGEAEYNEVHDPDGDTDPHDPDVPRIQLVTSNEIPENDFRRGVVRGSVKLAQRRALREAEARGDFDDDGDDESPKSKSGSKGKAKAKSTK
jgi:hypothetical protein